MQLYIIFMMMVGVVLGFNFNPHIIRNINQNKILKEWDYEIPDWVYSRVFEFNKLKSCNVINQKDTKDNIKSDEDNKNDYEKNFPDVGEISWSDILDKDE